MAAKSKLGIFSTYFYQRITLFHYTTSAISPKYGSSTLVVDYLVKSLGFSKQEAIITSSKVSTFKSKKNPDSVVNFLKDSGFDKTHVKKLVFTMPQILSSNVDKTLKPKFEAFQMLGLKGSDLANFACSFPDILRRSLDRHIIPTLEVLKTVFGYSSDDSVFLVKSLQSCSWMLASCARVRIPVNVALLRSYGFTSDQIRMFVHRKSRYIVLDSKWLKAILTRVEERLGIPRKSAMFFHGLCAMCSISEGSLKGKFELYKSFGWTESDVLTLARKNPYALVLSESKIKSTLNFFMKELGYPPAMIAARPCVLTFSLEKRVIPRNVVVKILKEKRLIRENYYLLSCLHINNSKFCQRFVEPYKDELPNLYDDFKRGVGSPLKAAK